MTPQAAVSGQLNSRLNIRAAQARRLASARRVPAPAPSQKQMQAHTSSPPLHKLALTILALSPQLTSQTLDDLPISPLSAMTTMPHGLRDTLIRDMVSEIVTEMVYTCPTTILRPTKILAEVASRSGMTSAFALETLKPTVYSQAPPK